jgi:hypothetical protein
MRRQPELWPEVLAEITREQKSVSTITIIYVAVDTEDNRNRKQ